MGAPGVDKSGLSCIADAMGPQCIPVMLFLCIF